VYVDIFSKVKGYLVVSVYECGGVQTNIKMKITLEQKIQTVFIISLNDPCFHYPTDIYFKHEEKHEKHEFMEIIFLV
jgi:hypothetical protein